MGTLIILFPALILVVVLAGSVAVYRNDRDRRNGKGRSLAFYIGGILIAGLVPSWLFIASGGSAFCYLFPGEACGWVAGGIGLPAFFGLGIGTFIYFWRRHDATP